MNSPPQHCSLWEHSEQQEPSSRDPFCRGALAASTRFLFRQLIQSQDL